MERSWKYRRSVVFITLGFCMGILFALVVLGTDSMLYRDIASGCFLLMGTTIGAYVFGSAWDDRNRDKAIAEGVQPFADGPQP